MSGQHSPHDTGRGENPAETDLGGIKSKPGARTLSDIDRTLFDLGCILISMRNTQSLVLKQLAEMNARMALEPKG